MQKYKIFAGLGGSFGGAYEIETEEFENQEEADNRAWECAIEEFESYGGLHGLPTWEEALEEAELYIIRDDYDSDSEYQDALEDHANEVYNENREHWLEYYAKLIE